jgi:hypothetical protein
MMAHARYALGLVLLLGCGDDGGGGGADSGCTAEGPIRCVDGAVEIPNGDGGTVLCYPTTCDGHLTECGDCVDNDSDGRIDFVDRECLGPCDNTEGAQLTTGVGGEAGTSCVRDCYFDFGNGPGNDDCVWDLICDPLAPDPRCPYDESRVPGRDCRVPQTEMCLTTCRPLTPNGCDCFGCCTFEEIAARPDAEGGAWVWLGTGIGDGPDGEGTCTFADIEDTSLCHPCVPVEDCFNDCAMCELCIGRDTIPDECYEPDAGTYARCPAGEQECGLPGDAACPLDYYCITGCCQPTII